MGKLGAAFVAVAGLGCLALAAIVAMRGGEPPIPSGPGVIEGTATAGETVPSPVGEPVLFGEVRLTDLRSDGERTRRRYWSQTFGDPVVVLDTGSGARTVELDAPERWYAPHDRVTEERVDSLAGLPVVGSVDVQERLAPPYILRLWAVRPGDPLLVAADGRVYLGTRESLEAERASREGRRWPAVLMLAVLGLVSVVGGGGALRRAGAGRG